MEVYIVIAIGVCGFWFLNWLFNSSAKKRLAAMERQQTYVAEVLRRHEANIQDALRKVDAVITFQNTRKG